MAAMQDLGTRVPNMSSSSALPPRLGQWQRTPRSPLGTKQQIFRRHLRTPEATGTDYGLGLAATLTAPKTVRDAKAAVPLELEKGDKPPLNTFKNKEPFVGKIVSVERIVGPNATGETCNIVIDHGGKYNYWEGQSAGVLPPGTKIDSKGREKPQNVRLYSIASTRYGDDFDGKTTTLVVRRATYWDEETNKEDPERKGVCSNYLCDAKPGDEVNLTGPTGTVMLLPEDPKAVHIMVATGTGIAPFRAYIRRFFLENIDGADFNFDGLAWLFMGAANEDAKLYDDEFQECLKRYPDQFRLDYALSRVAKNKSGGKMYIQDKMEEYKDQVFGLLDKGAHIYFCGLKGMMPGIQDMLKDVCKEKDIDFDEWLKGLKKNKQWHVEVY